MTKQIVSKRCRRIMTIITDNKLDSSMKYEAFRKANPKLALPHHTTVLRNYHTKGWNW